VSKPLEQEIAAARARRERTAAQLHAEDIALERLIEAQQALISAVIEEHRDTVLHNRHGRAIEIDTMDTTTTTRGPKLETSHVGAKRIRKVDGSISAFARKHGLHRTTVRSWYATEGDAARRIPRKWANLLAKPPYEIPEIAWRNGIED
jgi:hypothetical protein